MSLSTPHCLSQLAASGVGLLFALAPLGIVAARRPLGRRLTYAACMLICAGLAGVALVALFTPGPRLEFIQIPVGLPLGRTLLGFDPLNAAFAVIINVATAIVSGYAIGYGTHAREPVRIVPFYPAFIAGMNLVLLAQDAFSFLVGWEFMSLASWALVVSEDASSDNRRAALIYLIMATGGALTLLLAFGLLAGPEGGYAFEQIRRAAASGVGPIVLILALVGAGSKAGLVPLHAWLPLAHPAAPSHVSALMSGVMTKVAVYGFVRIIFDLAGPPSWWWSVPVLLIAGITALLGVLYALMEHDLKRLLAYHTVENIGIIFIGLWLALAFEASGLGAAAALALTAAIFHVFNHSLFKSLLFLGSGAVLNATGQRDMEHLGGLIHRYFRAAALQRVRLRVAHLSGDSDESTTAALGSETAGARDRRDAGVFGGARGRVFRQSVRDDVSGPAPFRRCEDRQRDGSLVHQCNAHSRGAVSTRRNPARLRDRRAGPGDPDARRRAARSTVHPTLAADRSDRPGPQRIQRRTRIGHDPDRGCHDGFRGPPVCLARPATIPSVGLRFPGRESCDPVHGRELCAAHPTRVRKCCLPRARARL